MRGAPRPKRAHSRTRDDAQRTTHARRRTGDDTCATAHAQRRTRGDARDRDVRDRVARDDASAARRRTDHSRVVEALGAARRVEREPRQPYAITIEAPGASEARSHAPISEPSLVVRRSFSIERDAAQGIGSSSGTPKRLESANVAASVTSQPAATNASVARASRRPRRARSLRSRSRRRWITSERLRRRAPLRDSWQRSARGTLVLRATRVGCPPPLVWARGHTPLGSASRCGRRVARSTCIRCGAHVPPGALDAARSRRKVVQRFDARILDREIADRRGTGLGEELEDLGVERARVRDERVLALDLEARERTSLEWRCSRRPDRSEPRVACRRRDARRRVVVPVEQIARRCNLSHALASAPAPAFRSSIVLAPTRRLQWNPFS